MTISYHGGINAIEPQEEDRLQNEIIAPSHRLDFFGLGELALDLIGWYNLNRSYPVPWSVTIPAQWATNPRGLFESDTKYNHIGSFRSFQNTIQCASQNDKVRKFTDQALEGYCGRSEFEPFKKGCYLLSSERWLRGGLEIPQR
jgi:hypothetical protein